MYELGKLKPKKGSKKNPKRVARGHGSGWGKTGGRGNKGQLSRTGGKTRPGFEGGQTPLYRRLPKFGGFSNYLFKKKYYVINLDQLSRAGKVVTPESLKEAGVIKNMSLPVKVLGRGELKEALNVSAHKFSKSAEKKIKAAGGKAEILKAGKN